jgi:hypothetical protein
LGIHLVGLGKSISRFVVLSALPPALGAGNAALRNFLLTFDSDSTWVFIRVDSWFDLSCVSGAPNA